LTDGYGLPILNRRTLDSKSSDDVSLIIQCNEYWIAGVVVGPEAAGRPPTCRDSTAFYTQYLGTRLLPEATESPLHASV